MSLMAEKIKLYLSLLVLFLIGLAVTVLLIFKASRLDRIYGVDLNPTGPVATESAKGLP